MTQMRTQSNHSSVSGLTRRAPVVFIVVLFLVVSICSEAGETPPDPRANESNDNDPGYSLARTCIDISGVKLPKDAIGVYQQFSDDRCQKFKSGAIDRNAYRQNLYHAARYFRICTLKTNLRSSYQQKLSSENQSDFIVKIFRQFCGRVVDDNGVKWVTNLEHWQWLSTNLFCATIREIVGPVGWRGVVLQRETQSYKRLEAITSPLCNQLRSNRINLDQAISQFEQEVYLYDKEAGTNHAKSLQAYMADYFN